MPDEAMTCPSCRTPLERSVQEEGVFWACDGCGGRAATLPLLRKIVEEDALKELWRLARSGGGVKKRSCPSCGNYMVEIPPEETVTLPTDSEPDGETTETRPPLDICVRCCLVWFDAGEELPVAGKAPNEKDELPLAAREALAIAQIQMIADSEQRRSTIERTSNTIWSFLSIRWAMRF